MNIGIEASSLVNRSPTGIAVYVKQLLKAMIPQLGCGDGLRLFYKLTRWGQRDLWWRTPDFQVRSYYKSLWPVNKAVDLVHLPDSVIINWKNIKRVITIHDLLVLIKDDDHIAPQKFRDKKRKIYEHMINSADAILADTETTKKDICRLFNVAEKKIHVVYLGIDHQTEEGGDSNYKSILSGYGLESGYLLFLGAISGRKNTDRLVRAFAASKAVKDRKLVLAGPVSYKGELTLAAIEECGLTKKVLITGYVPEEHVAALYRGAGAFVFPTLYEGFGMPILEAMAYGVPVLTSTTGSAPEISAGHALCVDPYREAVIAEGIDRVLETDEKTRAKARAHSRKFTWDRCAGKTLDVYRQAV
ncbi:MAG: glycosyltransferase family 1 protein [Desulfobacteraceae bacterium]|nr:MAG: glycosyltransferase family 1 protein [Desulfobacteraceae bacterium]